jgi:hypothetical protein
MQMLTRYAALTALTIGSLVAVGCSSTDRHVFESTATRSATISAIDAVTQEQLWAKEIPPGHKLVVDMDRTFAHESPLMATAAPADRLEWWLYPGHKAMIVRGYSVGKALDEGTVDLPGSPVVLTYTLGEAPRAGFTAPEIAPETGSRVPTPPAPAEEPGTDPDAVEQTTVPEPTPTPDAEAQPAPTPTPAPADAAAPAPAAEETPSDETDEQEEEVMFK